MFKTFAKMFGIMAMGFCIFFAGMYYSFYIISHDVAVGFTCYLLK